jgi:hypothetical protein
MDRDRPGGSRRPGIVRTTDSSLWGRTVQTTAGWIQFAPPEEDEGGAGVREPRRPKPAAPAVAAVADEDEGVVLTC